MLNVYHPSDFVLFIFCISKGNECLVRDGEWRASNNDFDCHSHQELWPSASIVHVMHVSSMNAVPDEEWSTSVRTLKFTFHHAQTNSFYCLTIM